MTDQQLFPARLSAFWPYTPATIRDVAPWMEMTAHGAFHRLWMGQSVAIDTAAAISYAAGAGHQCPIGIAVNVIPMHNPLSATQSVRAIASATQHGVKVCYSVGDPVAQERFTGQRYASSLTATREFLTVVRELLTGERVRHAGTYFTVDARLPAPDLSHRVRLGIGVLRPGMARLAGEIADTAATWLTPPTYLRDVLVPALEEGAIKAGRTGRPELVVPVHAILAAPGRDAGVLAEVAIGKHLRTPSYRKLLDLAGLGHIVDKGPAAALESGLVTYGDADAVAERVRDIAAAGADEIPIVLHQPPGTPWPAAREEWLGLGEALANRLLREPAAAVRE